MMMTSLCRVHGFVGWEMSRARLWQQLYWTFYQQQLRGKAARDCWILRRMIWNGVIWCGKYTDEADDGPLQEPPYYSYTDPNMVGWVISHIWCSYSTSRYEFPRSGVYSFHLFFLCLLNLHLFTKPSSDNLLGLGRDDNSNDKVQSDQAVDKHYWHFGRGENGTSLNGKSSKTLRKTCNILVKFQRKFNHLKTQMLN